MGNLPHFNSDVAKNMENSSCSDKLCSIRSNRGRDKQTWICSSKPLIHVAQPNNKNQNKIYFLIQHECAGLKTWTEEM
eukprot:12757385-Ditylum_brightwellii.AAC.1